MYLEQTNVLPLVHEHLTLPEPILNPVLGAHENRKNL
jgi:hypothetical protein